MRFVIFVVLTFTVAWHSRPRLRWFSHGTGMALVAIACIAIAVLTVPIGLGVKERSPHEHTFIAGYTNGYIYYCPTAEQLLNVGGAQEDSDCLLAPEWQGVYENKVTSMLKDL